MPSNEEGAGAIKDFLFDVLLGDSPARHLRPRKTEQQTAPKDKTGSGLGFSLHAWNCTRPNMRFPGRDSRVTTQNAAQFSSRSSSLSNRSEGGAAWSAHLQGYVT
jgi:hypothetical protein